MRADMDAIPRLVLRRRVGNISPVKRITMLMEVVTKNLPTMDAATPTSSFTVRSFCSWTRSVCIKQTVVSKPKNTPGSTYSSLRAVSEGKKLR